MTLVKFRVVGKERPDIIPLKNLLHILKHLSARADHFVTGQRELHYVGEHTAHPAFGSENIVLPVDAPEGFRVCDLYADGHHLVRPVCLSVDNGEITLVKASARLKIGSDRLFCDSSCYRVKIAFPVGDLNRKHGVVAHVPYHALRNAQPDHIAGAFQKILMAQP